MILRRRITILVVIAVLTCFMGYMATKVRMQYESSSVLPEKDSTNRIYKHFVKQFGQDGTIMFIGLLDTQLFTLNHFNALCDLSDSLKKIKGVSEILSVTRLVNLVKDDSLKKFVFVPISPRKPVTRQEVDSIKALIYSLPFYNELIYVTE